MTGGWVYKGRWITCGVCSQNELSCLSTEDSGRGSSIPPSPGSLLVSQAVTDQHPAQENTEESPLAKASQSPNGTPPTLTTERRSSRASLESSNHSSEEGHPLLSLSCSQVQKPRTTSKRDSVAVVTFRNGFNPLHSAIRVSVRGWGEDCLSMQPTTPSLPLLPPHTGWQHCVCHPGDREWCRP